MPRLYFDLPEDEVDGLIEAAAEQGAELARAYAARRPSDARLDEVILGVLPEVVADLARRQAERTERLYQALAELGLIDPAEDLDSPARLRAERAQHRPAEDEEPDA